MINHKNKDELQTAYSIMSIRDIAKRCSVSPATIRYYVKKFGIKTRSISKGMLLKSDHISQRSKNHWSNKANRTKHSEIMKRIQSNRKQKLSESAKKNWEKNRDSIIAGIKKSTTDVKKKKISESLKKSWTPARKKLQSELAVKLWKDSEYFIKTTQGINLATSSDEFKQKVSANSKRMWKSKQYRQKQATAISNLSPISILDNIIINSLQSMGIDAQPISLGPWSFDVGFSYKDRNILIECQGEYWHSRPSRITRDKQKKTYFDKYLSDKWELYYIYEHQFYGLNSIRHILKNVLHQEDISKQFDLKHVEVKIIRKSVINDFFNLYHYLSKGRAGLGIGAFLDNKLVAAINYTGITRLQTAARLNLEHKEILELQRLCIHPEYHKKNFASWFIAKSMKFIPKHIKTLIAFSDIGAGHSGTVYKAAGWQEDGRTKPSYWYIDSNGTRYYKKSVWDQAKRLRMKEQDYANTNGLHKIKGLEVLRFIKHL